MNAPHKKRQSRLYRSWIRLVIILIFLTVFLSCHTRVPLESMPIAEHGVLDLKAWNFGKDGPVHLRGQWAFYWHKLLSPLDFSKASDPPHKRWAMVPSTWNSISGEDRNVPGHGFATYRLKVFLSDTSESLAFKMLDVDTAYALYVNGQKLGGAGIVGKDRNVSRPEWRPKLFDFTPDGNELDIILQVSNFHHCNGGADKAILLGTSTAIEDTRNSAWLVEFFLFSSIFAIGLYHLVCLLTRRSERSLLYFGWYCIIVSFYTLLVGEIIFKEIFPGSSWQMILRLLYLTMYLAVPLFLLVIRSLFPDDTSRRLVNLVLTVGVAFCIAVLFLDSTTVSMSLQIYKFVILGVGIYVITVLVSAALRKKEDALTLLIGFLIFFAAITNDILHNSMIIQTAQFIPLGLFIFIFSMAALISSRNARIFTQMIALSNSLKTKSAELEVLNENLQTQIRERITAESKITASLKEKKILLREIHHRVKNNFQVIQGLMSMTRLQLEDTVTAEKIMDLSSRIDAMSLIHDQLHRNNDLGRIHLETHIRRLVDNIASSYQGQTRRVNVVIGSSDVYLTLTQAVPCALILNELVSNAFKYAFDGMHGGDIQIDLAQEAGWVRIRVRDNGIGITDGLGSDNWQSTGLSMVSGLVTDQLDGTLAYSNRNGSEFVIRFPWQGN